jgi:3-phytase
MASTPQAETSTVFVTPETVLGEQDPSASLLTSTFADRLGVPYGVIARRDRPGRFVVTDSRRGRLLEVAGDNSEDIQELASGIRGATDVAQLADNSFVVVTRNGQLFSVPAAGGEPTAIPFSGDVAPVSSYGIAVTAGDLLVISDYGGRSSEGRLLEVTITDGTATALVVTPEGIGRPTGVTIAHTGRYVVADFEGNRLLEIDPAGPEDPVLREKRLPEGTQPADLIEVSRDVFVVTAFRSGELLKATLEDNQVDIIEAARELRGKPYGITQVGNVFYVTDPRRGDLLQVATNLERGKVRIAQFNASVNRNSAGELISNLSTPDNTQAKTVAEIIQRVNPDIILINEFDYDPNNEAARLFRDNYLAIGQNGADPVLYPYFYTAPSNTGIASGFDLDNNGSIVTTPGAPGYGNDAFGFGNFEGQFGMIIYSKYPIDTNRIRTFQNFLWKDMPGAQLPDDPATPDIPADWYSQEELAVFRLSSKSHWDVPINVKGSRIHILASHPTPPVFDGPEDRNGTRNSDEIRFWSDYVTPRAGSYIVDDAGRSGGLFPGSSFVIMGDQNADPFDGDSTPPAISQLLNNPNINTRITPISDGAVDAALRQGLANNNHLGNPKFDTADFSDTTPGNLRTDYVLPSRDLRILDARVFWPTEEDPLFRLVGNFPFPSSDHRLVWIDVEL